MGVRKEFVMDEDTYQAMLTKPGPVMKVGDVWLNDFAQSSANDKWRKLGEKMGFDGMTAEPIPGKDAKHFSAVVIDNG